MGAAIADAKIETCNQMYQFAEIWEWRFKCKMTG